MKDLKFNSKEFVSIKKYPKNNHLLQVWQGWCWKTLPPEYVIKAIELFKWTACFEPVSTTSFEMHVNHSTCGCNKQKAKSSTQQQEFRDTWKVALPKCWFKRPRLDFLKKKKKHKKTISLIDDRTGFKIDNKMTTFIKCYQL